MVDAARAGLHLNPGIAQAQVDFAGRLLLSKTDLVEPARLGHLVEGRRAAGKRDGVHRRCAAGGKDSGWFRSFEPRLIGIPPTVRCRRKAAFFWPRFSDQASRGGRLQEVLFLVHLAASDLKINVQFFRSALGNEPVREWLKGLALEERYLIGMEIKTVQLGWPLGMPLVRKLEHGLWEIRVDMGHVVARVLFTIMDGVMFMLHGFIKKSQKTPSADLALARQRKASLRRSTT